LGADRKSSHEGGKNDCRETHGCGKLGYVVNGYRAWNESFEKYKQASEKWKLEKYDYLQK
jgi:hypothetical protein